MLRQQRPTPATVPCSKSKLVREQIPRTTRIGDKERQREGRLRWDEHPRRRCTIPSKVSCIEHPLYTLTYPRWSKSIGIALTSSFTVTPRLYLLFFFPRDSGPCSPDSQLVFFFPFFAASSLFFFIISVAVCYSRLLNFFRPFFWPSCSLFFGQLSLSPGLIDDRSGPLRPVQSISLHTWVGFRYCISTSRPSGLRPGLMTDPRSKPRWKKLNLCLIRRLPSVLNKKISLPSCYHVFLTLTDNAGTLS